MPLPPALLSANSPTQSNPIRPGLFSNYANASICPCSSRTIPSAFYVIAHSVSVSLSLFFISCTHTVPTFVPLTTSAPIPRRLNSALPTKHSPTTSIPHTTLPSIRHTTVYRSLPTQGILFFILLLERKASFCHHPMTRVKHRIILRNGPPTAGVATIRCNQLAPCCISPHPVCILQPFVTLCQIFFLSSMASWLWCLV